MNKSLTYSKDNNYINKTNKDNNNEIDNNIHKENLNDSERGSNNIIDEKTLELLSAYHKNEIEKKGKHDSLFKRSDNINNNNVL